MGAVILSENPLQGDQTANDEDSLFMFLRDVAAHSLENTYKLNPYYFGFHLDLALNRQIALLGAEWDSVARTIEKAPISLSLTDQGPQILPPERAEFVSTLIINLIEEVANAKNDSWGAKLLKTGFCSTLDKDIKACKQALIHLSYKEEDAQDYESLTLQNLAVLQYNYLKTLRDFPFLVEEALEELQQATTISLSPDKQAEFVTRLLDCAAQTVSPTLGELLNFSKPVLQLMMPTLPLNDLTYKVLNQKLLPQLRTILYYQAEIERAKQQFFSTKDLKKAAARHALYDQLGIQFRNLGLIVTDMLIKPAQELTQAYTQGAKLADLSRQCFQEENPIDRALAIGQAFFAFNQARSDIQNRLPLWAQKAVTLYGGFSAPQQGQQSWQEFGEYYLGIVAGTPERMYRFLQITSTETAAPLVLQNFSFKKALILLEFCNRVETARIPQTHWISLYDAFKRDLTGQKTPSDIESIRIELKTFLDSPYYSELQQLVKTDLSELLQASSFDTLPQLAAIVQLKQMEMQCSFLLAQEFSEANFQHLENLLEEIKTADNLLAHSDKPELASFKTTYFEPFKQAVLINYSKTFLLPCLEKAMDHYDSNINMAYYHHLPKAYTQLGHNVPLSGKQVQRIERCLEDWEDIPGFKNTTWKIFKALSPATVAYDCQTETYTPAQTWQAGLRDTLHGLSVSIKEYALPQLDQQNEILDRLEPLIPHHPELRELIQAKKEYCEAIQAVLNVTRTEIENNPYAIAKVLYTHLSGQSLLEGLQASYLTMAKQLGQFLWFVAPSGAPSMDDQILTNILRYYLKEQRWALNLYEKRAAYLQKVTALKQDAALILLQKPLSDPLHPNLLLPQAQDVMKTLTESIQSSTLTDQISFSVEVAAQLSPFPLITNTLLTVLRSKAFAEKARPWIQGLQQNLLGYSESALDYGQRALGYFVDMEWSKTQERLAIEFVDYPVIQDNRAKAQAFAEFYLKFKILQKGRVLTQEQASALLAFVFQDQNPDSLEKLLSFIQRLDAMDTTQHQDDLFSWLLAQTQATGNNQSIYRMALNYYILEAIKTKHWEFAQTEKLIEQLGATAPQELEPALAALKGLLDADYVQQTQQCSDKVKQAIREKQTILADDAKNPYLGRTQIGVKWSNYKIHWLGLWLSGLKFLLETGSALLTWVFLAKLLLSGSGLFGVALFALGLSNGLSLVAVAALGVLTAIRFGYEFSKELWARKGIMNRIGYDPNRSLLNKIFALSWVVFKAGFVAICNTLLTSFVVKGIQKFSAIFGVVATLKEALRRNPSRASLERELAGLQALENDLSSPQKNLPIQLSEPLELLKKQQALLAKWPASQGNNPLAIQADNPVTEAEPAQVGAIVSVHLNWVKPIIRWDAYYQLLHKPTIAEQVQASSSQAVAIVTAAYQTSTQTLMDLPKNTRRFASAFILQVVNVVLARWTESLGRHARFAFQPPRLEVQTEASLIGAVTLKPQLPAPTSGWVPTLFSPTVQPQLIEYRDPCVQYEN